MKIIENLREFPGMHINFSQLSVFRYFVPDRESRKDFRNINNIYLILDGKYRYLNDNGDMLEAGAHDIVLLPYGSAYSRFLLNGSNLGNGFCLDFLMVDENGQNIIFPPHITHLTTDHDGYFESLYNSAMKAQLDSHGGFEFRSIVYNIFDKIFAETNKFSSPDSPWKIIAPAINSIERSPQNNISITELADRCNLSETRFRKLFRAYTGGMNPVEYRNSLRIMKAKELLLAANRSYSIENMADMLGFYDASYFIKTFERFTGMTPREYRNLTE